ncbi:MAG TPA: lipid-A-disaccharide synthase N-terminal domain-containing protein [Candidatus Sumerlaeota bacterium]|nr:lipid-A-disaccharide synthase N-terminal domain-containing protein [Candidatus Sumerlaeota bacterium]HPS01742.1 lipid-A-disaccharide synthase N-terminal domain-containing protein [Candidatus Sumerlaeota bacterium]
MMSDLARHRWPIFNFALCKTSILLLTGVVTLAAGFLTGCKDPEPAQLAAQATRNVLDKQCDRWYGSLSFQKMGGEVTTCSVTYELERQDATYEGTLKIDRPASAGRSDLFSIPVQFRKGDGERWQGRIGDSGPFLLRPALNAGGLPDKWRLSMVSGDQGLDLLLFGDAHMDLALSGRLPLPKELGPDVVWTDVRLHRDGFQIKIGRFNIILMECVGLFANLFFAWRFVIQWIASERAKRSVIPELFWWISLAGTVMMLVYAVYFGRLAVFIGQLTGWVVYIRNIWLIKREKQRLCQVAQEEANQETGTPKNDSERPE